MEIGRVEGAIELNLMIDIRKLDHEKDGLKDQI